MAEAEVTIDASKGVITVKGEQSFVAETLEKYKFVFEQAPKPALGTKAPSGEEPTPIPSTTGDSPLAAFSNVFDVVGDDV